MNKQTGLGYIDGVTYVLTILAVLPYTLGAEADILPPEWKAKIAMIGLIAGGILKAIRGHITPEQKDNDADGNPDLR
jgi:hypothetical protein